MKHLTVSLATLAAAAMTAITPAMALDEEILAFPVPGTVERYLAEEPRIEELRAVVTDVSQPADARLTALGALNGDYPLAAQITARSLTVDPDTQVALAAIQLLATAMVMMNHEHEGDMSPAMAHMMSQYEANLEAMRKAELDERKEVRLKAAAPLVSLDDAPTYASIAVGIQSERYTVTEATNLYTLGGTELASAYLAPYLGSGEAAAENTAIGYLGALPDYQERIKDAYFLNDDAAPALRASAAEALGAYDASFGSYALDKLSEFRATPELYSAAVASYVSNQQVFGTTIDPGVARQLSDTIDDVLVDVTGPSQGDVTRNLTRIQENLRGIYLNAPSQ